MQETPTSSDSDTGTEPVSDGTPLRDMGLKIAGTALEPLIGQFVIELAACKMAALKPSFYLSTEWGVPFNSASIAIPFYLARPDLTRLQSERAGFVEGESPDEILRYFRHEMGHVINYAYKLYEEPEWTAHFGDFHSPYPEEYFPKPFSRDFVFNLPGWYGQKHPDEDWAETFAVWMTPGFDWRTHYAGAPALAKLEYCDRTITDLAKRPVPPVANDHDEDISESSLTLDEWYRDDGRGDDDVAIPWDDALRTIFPKPSEKIDPSWVEPADALIARLERVVATSVFRWTGYFPERTRKLLSRLRARAKEKKLEVAVNEAGAVGAALATFVTAYAAQRMSRGAH